jgi:serine/threonine protein kinase
MAEDPLEIVGATLDGRFRVDSLVDDGELSLSYRALDLTGHVPVAIRCLNLPMTLDAALAGPFVESFNERTKRHARLGAGHPVFVKLLGSGTTRSPSTGLDVPYEVREWLEATTLTSYIAKRRAKGATGWPLDFVLSALDPVADGLTYSHAMGVVHGAINPNNLIVVEGGSRPSVRIVDFGDARSEETASLRPVLRVLIPEYTAPEQVDKQVGSLGPWTDVFALAVIVLECLAGSLSTKGKAASMLVEPENRPTPKRLGLSLPPEVEQVLERALELEPARRQQDVATFWSELRAADGAKATQSGASTRTVQASSAPRGPSKLPLPPRRVNPLVKATLVGLQPQKPSAYAAAKVASPLPSPAPSAIAAAPPLAARPIVAQPLAPPSIAPPSFGEDEAPTRRRDGLSGAGDDDEPRLSPPSPPVLSEPPPAETLPTATTTGSFEEPDLFMPALGRAPLSLRLRRVTKRGLEWARDEAAPWIVARAKDDAPRARVAFGASVLGTLVLMGLCMSFCVGRGASRSVDMPTSASASAGYGSGGGGGDPSVAATPATTTNAPNAPNTTGGTPSIPAPPPIPSDIAIEVPATAPAPAAPVAFTKAAASVALDTAGADLSECRQLGTIRGPGSIRATFNKVGAVSRISIGPPYADTPEGACILDRFGRAQMPPVRGPGSINYGFNVPK